MDAYTEKIAVYLDNTMSAAEEAAFMQALGEQAALRQQFEEELILGSFFEAPVENVLKIPKVVSQPAPGVVNRRKRGFAAVKKLTRYKMVAAAVICLVAVVVAAILFSRKNTKTINALTTNTGTKKTLQDNATVADQPKKKPEGKMAPNAFDHFYTVYASNNDPVEISMYYNEYRQQQYDKVIAATETDFQLKGSGGKNKTLQHYMHLYKGLSYLGKNNPVKALEQFNAVLKDDNKRDPFFHAQWYAALASLKNNDTKRAARLAMEIVATESPYKARAAGLLKAIQTR